MLGPAEFLNCSLKQLNKCSQEPYRFSESSGYHGKNSGRNSIMN